jgi:hypothetical protein
MKSDEAPAGAVAGLTWRAVLLIVGLTLLVWVLWWEAEMPLTNDETAVVALVFTLLVVGGQYLRSWLNRVRTRPHQDPK